ncbi:hypothetical protein [Rhizobium sp. RU35A]|uniref:hypothetical protein n=1 Tax=Rhizobium sp. RU35A TaxID=1907414 RepID=UPI00122C8C54|nr:hypothetical protein [Rhizobium sp. RU35A]
MRTVEKSRVSNGRKARRKKRYEALLNGLPRVREPASKGLLLNDAEVALFCVERFGILPMEKIVADCAATFGEQRTPSVRSAYRFWKRLREAQQMRLETGDT